jgi:hypothetical protein
MKKVLVVFAAFLILAAFIPQKASAEVDFDLGIKAGISLAKIRFDEGMMEDFCSLKKPVVGAFFSLNLNDFLSVQPEIFLLQQGGSFEMIKDGTYRYELAFTYIHIPVLAKVKLIKEGQVKPILFAGPAVGFLSKAVERYYMDGVLEDEESVKQYLKSTNFSAVFGGGVEFALEKLLLVLDVRYALGLYNINEDGEGSIKTGAIMIMGGVGF